MKNKIPKSIPGGRIPIYPNNILIRMDKQTTHVTRLLEQGFKLEYKLKKSRVP